jgi:hypothetical protein
MGVSAGNDSVEAAHVSRERKPVISFEFGLRMGIKAAKVEIC